MIDAMLAAAVASNPDGPAIVFGGGELGYRELHAMVSAFGQRLRDRGVRPGDHVVIVLPNCPEFVLGYFAAARIGATVQALDPALSVPELAGQLELAAALITTPEHADRLRGSCSSACTVVVVDQRSPFPRVRDAVQPAVGIDPALPWVTVLSSGSTGEAKRITRSQANQVAEADNIVTSAALTARDVILCPVPLFHALGQFCCLVAAVRAGATLVLLDHDSVDSIVEQIVSAVERHQVTVLAGVPYLFEALLGLPVARRVDFTSLRLCLSGSNFLPAAVPGRFRARFGIPLRQTYGSTEAGSVSWDLDPDPRTDSVGRPLHGVSVQIVGEDGEPLPAQAVGEIAVRGKAVIVAGSDGWYRTGDLGRLDAAGRLYVIGRTRLLIDSGGHKVNPIEVEDVLRQHPTVSDVAVVGLPLRGGGELLAAAVVAGSPDHAGLLAHCRDRLAVHKIPQRLHFVGQIPRTPTGKVRRARLSDMLAGAEGDQNTHAAELRDRLRWLPPRRRTAALTAYLTTRIAEILGTTRETLDQHGTLGAAGVDSLGALRLRMLVQDELRVSVQLPELLGRSSITSLAQRLADRLSDAPAGESCDVLAAGPVAGEFSLSVNQRSLWHAEQVNPDNAVYVVAFAARITSSCDSAALRRAFQLLVDRHPVLRTTFPDVGAGVPVQRVAEQSTVDFQVVDVPADWDETGRAALHEDTFRAFDLATAPALRVRLYLGASRGPVLSVAQHHLITDYWSLVVMLRELAAGYAAESSGSDLYLPTAAHGYTDYGRWLDQVTAGPTGRDDLAYWSRRLDPPPPAADLPTDHDRPVVRRQAGATLRQELSDVDGLRAVARAHGTTVYALLLTVCHVWLRAHTGNDDSAVAVNTANRHRNEFRDVLGYFANPIVHRTRIEMDEPFAALLRRVGTTLLADLGHQSVTFEQLATTIGAARDRSRAPLVEVGFGQNKAHDAGLAQIGAFLSAADDGHRCQLGALTLESVALRKTGVVFDFAGAVYESDDAVAIVWEYDTALFEPATVRRMTDRFATILAAVTAAPDTSVRDIPVEHPRLPADAGRRALLPRELATVTDSIAAHTAARPDAPAIEQDGASVTRAELDRRADVLAAAIGGLTTVDGSVVAVLASSVAELAAAGIGALRAGACCAALDSGLQPDQVRAAVADYSARLLVTTAARRDALGTLPIPVLAMDEESPGGTRDARVPPHLDSPALVLRTAGAAGPARPVLIPHRALAAAAHHDDTGPAGAVPLCDSHAGDHTLATMLRMLARGDTVVAVPGNEFAAAIGSGRAWRSVTLTPTELAHVLNHVEHARTTPRVDTLVLSGEVLPARLVRRWRAHADRTRIVHEYGGAELGLAVAAGDVAEVVDGVVAVGRPLPGVTCSVLDQAARPCPIGVLGEICVAEDSVARPLRGELPADRLVPEPGAPGRRLYRTGDAGRYLATGDLVVLGRADRGRHGLRSDPVRVEEALHAVAGVGFAVVTRDATGLSTAHVEAVGTAVTVARLRAALSEQVPHHLVPDHIVLTDRAPAAGNGKAARVWSCGDRTDAAVADDTPAGPVAAALAAIWAEVLGVEHVGPDDDYYELGGDSVMTIRIATKAAEQGIRLTRRQIFTHPTVRALTSVVGATAPPTALAHGLSRHRSIPLTPIQHWFFDQDLPVPGHWGQTLRLAAQEPVDPSRLRAAIQAVANRHSVFRYRYRRRADGWEQVLDRTGDAVGIEERTARDRAEWARAVADTHAGIDLAAGPLLRTTIVHDRDGGVSLVLAAHHLVMDLLSWGVVLDDLERAYRRPPAAEPTLPPDSSTPFDVWARRLSGHADSALIRDQLGYWIANTESPPPGPASTEGQARFARRRLSRDRTAALLASAGGHRVHHAVLASVVHAVASQTGESSVLVDLEGHGRADLFDDVDVARTVGWFTGLYPVAFPVGPSTSPARTLVEVSTALDQVPGAGLGHGLLRYCCSDGAIRERMAELPRAAVSFNYLGRLGGLLGESSHDSRARLFRSVPVPQCHDRGPDNPRPYRWEFSASLTGGVMTVNLVHGEEPAVAERMLDRVCECISAVIEEPGRGR